MRGCGNHEDNTPAPSSSPDSTHHMDQLDRTVRDESERNRPEFSHENKPDWDYRRDSGAVSGFWVNRTVRVYILQEEESERGIGESGDKKVEKRLGAL
jgi:hypothetical protein